MLKLTSIAIPAVVIIAIARPAEAQWEVKAKTDAMETHVHVGATAKSADGLGSMEIACDTRSGFKISFSPGHFVMNEGIGSIILKVDGGAPGKADVMSYGYPGTLLVNVINGKAFEKQLAGASKVTVRYLNNDHSSSDQAFEFSGLAKNKADLLKACPAA